MTTLNSPIRTGYFGGSFNPIHEGHIRLGTFLLQAGYVDEVWYVVSPQNPLKTTADPNDTQRRLDGVRHALKNHPGLMASDVECTLPLPSYTVDNLKTASLLFPDRRFSLIIGGDNLDAFTKWKGYEMLLAEYDILVYPRPGASNKVPVGWNRVTLVNAPLMDISSTRLRNDK